MPGCYGNKSSFITAAVSNEPAKMNPGKIFLTVKKGKGDKEVKVEEEEDIID